MQKQVELLKKPDDLTECFKIRNTIFIQEQKFLEEIDEIDDTAHHILLKLDSEPVATARYFIKNDVWYVGRFCVMKKHRKLGLGLFLMNEIEKDIIKKGFDHITLSSQYPVREFYKKAGYVEVGEMYLEENYPHIKMEKHI